VVIDWNYLNAPRRKKLPTWQVVVPPNAGRRLLLPGDQQGRTAPGGRTTVAGVPLQRRGQNLYAAGGVRPVRADEMLQAGTIDKAAVDKIPVIDGPVTVPSPDQTDKATKYLTDNWAKAVG
jgi:putative spermidine/putrescine transport system substrate-binding protein